MKVFFRKRRKINWVYDEGEASSMIEWTRNEMNVLWIGVRVSECCVKVGDEVIIWNEMKILL
jgi:hypothetical protein